MTNTFCLVIFRFMIFLHFLPGSDSMLFSCDPVNEGKQCLCSQTDPGRWDIQCPSKLLEVYPITVKITLNSEDSEEGSVRIICDPGKNDFPWKIVQGLDFDSENMTFAITQFDVSYCPIIPTNEMQAFFQQLRLDPQDILSLSYQTWKDNVTSFPEDFLNFFPNLEVVDLTNNKLKEIPKLQTLEFLHQLDLRGNSIEYLNETLFSGNGNLEQIRLGGNLITSLISPVFPSPLKLLDLVDNKIRTISNGSLANLKELQKLYLNGNPLEKVGSGAFTQLKNLTELSLDYSKLFSLPVLRDLPKLTNLSISYSLFSSTQSLIATDAEDETTQKDAVTATDNTNFYTSTIPTTLGSDDNSSPESRMESEILPEENTDQQLIGNLDSLKKLVLINDDLKSLSWLGYLPSLTDLILSRNQLSSVPENLFRNIPSAIRVDFSKNAITELSEMQAPSMTFLDLSNNFIRSVDKTVFRMTKLLRVLLLSSNKIEYIHPRAFENLESLVILDLANNRITFEYGPVPTLMSLQPLIDTTSSGEGNEMMGGDNSGDDDDTDEIHSLNQSPLQYLRKVERVNLRNNLISKIFMDWTFVPTHLRSLDLSHNKIKSLHPRDLYFVSQDVRFDLRYNQIADVDMDFAELLLEPLENKNVVILLDGNPLHCDCHSIAFKKFSVKSYYLQYSDLRCATPERLKGHRFHEVPTAELRCPVSQACPEDCTCWELPSENLIKLECNSAAFLTDYNTLRNLTEIYDPLEVEIDFSFRKLGELMNDTLLSEIMPQIRLLNLTNTGITSLEFLKGLSPTNNITKFALSRNPFKCEDCSFQKTWWKYFRRIVDVRGITCYASGGQVFEFQDIVRRSCSEEGISDEIRYLAIFFAIGVPVIISTIICITRLYKGNEKSPNGMNGGGGNVKRRRKKRHPSLIVGTIRAESQCQTHNTLSHQSRSYSPTRSKVVDMDSSRF